MRVAPLLLLLAAAAWAADEVYVVSGPDSLKKLVEENDFVVLELYAPWCGHCKKLEPEYAKAAEMLKGHEPKITLAKCDATDKANEKIKTQFKIQGFPTMKIIKGGKVDSPLDYQGPRDAEGIVKYLKKQVQPATSELKDAKAVEAFLESADVSVLAYVTSNTTAEFATFAAVADKLRSEVDFAYVTDAALLESKGCGKGCKSPFVVMHKKGEKEQPKYEGEFKEELLRTWTESRMMPLVAKFGQDPAQMKAIQKVFQSSLPKFVAVAKEEDAELLGQLAAAAEANDEVKFVFATPKQGQRLLDYYGIKEADLTVLFIDDQANRAKYMKKGAKASDVATFLKEFHDGALEKHVKTEEPPADNSGPVKVVVATTFNELVLGGKTDVLIEFYAPWCGHCKRLAPIYDEIGEHYKDASDVIIAKLDATANDIPSPKFSVHGFPTLMFVTKAGDVVPYSGDRSKDSLIKFIEDNRTEKQEAEEMVAAAPAEAEEEEAEKRDEL